MGVENVCNCVEKHPKHICVLKNKGLVSAVRDLTHHPNVVCLNCGEVVKSEDNVCIPAPLFI